MVLGKAQGLDRRQLDQLATAMLSKCGNARWPGDPARYAWADFHRLRAEIHEKYYVPATSITVLASRVLWGTAVTVQPRTVVGVGTFYGNALSWVLGPGFSDLGLYTGKRAVALDINAEAVSGFERNAASVGLRVECLAADGVSWLDRFPGSIDLLFLDLDTPEKGKWGYLDCFHAARSKLAPQAVIVAHDVLEQKFEAEMSCFVKTVGRDAAWITRLATDDYGVGIAQL